MTKTHAQAAETAPAASPTRTKCGYAAVNGLNIYYEFHGAGRPLVLLHGGLTTIETSFGKVLPAFAATKQVIAVEQQAHGHTADIDRPLTFEQMADDTAAVLRHLNIESADFFGFSDGGNVALGVAIRHPALVSRLVVAGTNYSNDGLHPGILDFMMDAAGQDPAAAAAGMPAELRAAYAKAAPRPEDWPVLVSKVMKQAVAFKGWRADDIRSIKAPILIVIGDADIVRPEHAVEMFRLHGGGAAGDISGLPDSRLAILPGTAHMALMERADWLVSMIGAFLDAPAPKAK